MDRNFVTLDDGLSGHSPPSYSLASRQNVVKPTLSHNCASKRRAAALSFSAGPQRQG